MRIILLILLAGFLAAFTNGYTILTKNPEHPTKSNDNDKNKILQSNDFGRTWQDISKGLPQKFMANCIFSQGKEVFLGTDNGVMFYNGDAGTGTWERKKIGWPFLTEKILGNTVNKDKMVAGFFPGRDGVYASIYESGFFKMSPEKNTWQSMHDALEEKIIYAIAENQEGTIFAACHEGIYRSSDNGISWKHIYSKGEITDLVYNDGVLLGGSSNGLIRSTDGGEHWEIALNDEGGSYNLNIIGNGFAAIPVGRSQSNSNEDKMQETLISNDGGKTWHKINYGMLAVENIYKIEQVGKFLFCSHKGGISRSTDGGVNWELVRSSTGLGEMMRLEMSASDQSLYVVSVWDGC